ncbi:tRNA lysidine(34) synthetase TilS [Pseudomonas gingeri]|uniref:tRNA(Ile)-lysidine synthase n=1 Tax=Pseudomonas gingeri TaxID=117681 RepID=A0A7Y7X7T4_9PSED|nr:tRNA lysidine(34) synthetase TilS [Pseudomonas gingeri]NWB94566.1 tRNA lysidine(34) synthetase TilS [Pseudomonas gingeri]
MRHPDIDLPSRLLEALSPWRNAQTWRIGFSGGLDSTVLLHLLATLAKTRPLPRIAALHVHHGLQAVADGWPAHCQAVCDELGVPLQVIRVSVQLGASLERAARDARYLAFAGVTQLHDVLLTAQHREDQAETLLFRLLRGAGVRGLAAMPTQREVGGGYLVRPLLDVSRAELERYAREHDLRWIEDPSNSDQQFSRNFLRHRAFPGLTERWPQAVNSMVRSAAHLREAQELLDELAEVDLDDALAHSRHVWLGMPSLALDALIDLSPARQRNALRHWLAPLTRLPDSDHWAGWDDLRDAAHDARPKWRLAEGELHRADEHLWWLSGSWLRQPLADIPWNCPSRPLELPDNGELLVVGEAPPGPLQVRYRQGGEVLHLPDRGHRDLKRLLNESGVPWFIRGRLPLLYRGDELLAVANLPGLDGGALGDWHLHWQPPSSDQGLS